MTVVVLLYLCPAIVHPNYNCYIYDQGRVSAVTVRSPSEWSVIEVVPETDRYKLLHLQLLAQEVLLPGEAYA